KPRQTNRRQDRAMTMADRWRETNPPGSCPSSCPFFLRHRIHRSDGLPDRATSTSVLHSWASSSSYRFLPPSLDAESSHPVAGQVVSRQPSVRERYVQASREDEIVLPGSRWRIRHVNVAE